MKDKNYKSTRGAGDGDLTAGLLGMMDGGDTMDYAKMMMDGGSSSSMTYAQKAKYGREKMMYGKEKAQYGTEKKMVSPKSAGMKKYKM